MLIAFLWVAFLIWMISDWIMIGLDSNSPDERFERQRTFARKYMVKLELLLVVFTLVFVFGSLFAFDSTEDPYTEKLSSIDNTYNVVIYDKAAIFFVGDEEHYTYNFEIVDSDRDEVSIKEASDCSLGLWYWDTSCIRNSSYILYVDKSSVLRI